MSETRDADNPSLEEKRERLASLLRGRQASPAAPLPLTRGQQALWFLHQMAPESPAYNIGFAARVRSPLDPVALRDAFDRLVDHHTVLGGTITTVAGEPRQRLGSAKTAAFELVDVSGWTDERVRAEIGLEIQRPFDLELGPLMRVRVYQGNNGRAFLAWSVHHIAFDGWSLWVCLYELGERYSAAVRGVAAQEVRPRVDYGDYVRAEAERLAGDSAARDREYWRARLDGAPALNLPSDHARPPVTRYCGASHRFDLDLAATAALGRLARQERATLQMGVLALFSLLLQRYSSQDDFVVGYLASGRVRPEFDALVGYLANPMPLRTRVPSDRSFRALLAETRNALLEALDHQEYPFSKIVEDLGAERDPSRSPLFQVLFVFEKPQVLDEQDVAAFIVGEPGARLAIGGLVLESLPFPAQQPGQFDLTLIAVERAGALALSFDYNTDLFDGATISRMAGHWCRLAAAAVAEPDRALSTLEMLTAEEAAQLDAWNQTRRPELGESFHRLVEAYARRQPDRPAVVFEQTVVSYDELNRRANRFARHLARAGVDPGMVVGLCVERSPELIVAALGILKAGAAFLSLDPAYPRARLAFMVEDASVRVLVTQASLVTELPTGAAHVVLVGPDANAWPADATDVEFPSGPDALAYVIYTSGSTGLPKGVLLRHRGLVNVAAEQQRLFGVGPGDQVLQFASLSFDAAVFELAMALGSGATLHVARVEDILPGLPLLQTLRDRAITVVTLPPSALMNVPVHDLPHLRTITVAGEACPAELVKRWAGGRRFFNLYGPTETTIWATAMPCTDGDRAPTIGHPIGNTQVYVLDAHGRLAPVGVPGELYIGGAGLALGYHGRPELTAERFVANPFDSAPSGRLYKTGDLGRLLVNGEIEFLGRLDHQVKVRGFRIELGEIESVLASHPDVHECVVVVREDVPGAPRVVAYVVARSGTAAAPEALRAFLRTRVPEFMVPSAVVRLEAFPTSPAGKIDRQALPTPRDTVSTAVPVPPASDWERRVADVWREVLALEQVGIDDNFFDLGGSSLLLAQVHARLNARGATLSILEMFQLPTIRTLGARLAGTGTVAPAAVRDDSMRAGQARLRALARRRAGGEEGPAR